MLYECRCQETKGMIVSFHGKQTFICDFCKCPKNVTKTKKRYQPDKVARLKRWLERRLHHEP